MINAKEELLHHVSDMEVKFIRVNNISGSLGE